VKTSLRDTRLGPDRGEPLSLAEFVGREARGYRDRGTPEDHLVAETLERLAQLIAWTGAATPQEHRDRMEVWDETLRSQWWQRGYQAAIDHHHQERLHGPGAPPLPIDTRPYGLSGFLPPEID
jgi:hypothetical protein